ncbi:MAG: DedA family protein [Acidimicrobiales bacterium]
MSSLLGPLLSLGGAEAYALVAALCFGEAALFLGFVLPGETAVILGGVLASEHHVSLVGMCLIAVGGAIAGDSVGYEVGRIFGPWLLQHRPLKGRRSVERTRALIKNRGAVGVFIGRFVAVFRALVPGIAGVSGMPYRRFLVANASGGLIWGLGYTFAGFEVGKAYAKVITYGTYVSSSILGLAAIALVVFVVWRRRREHRKDAEPEA